MITTVYRLVYPWGKRIVTLILVPYCLCEYAVLVLIHSRGIRRAEFVFPMMFGSFGHMALEPHALAMRFERDQLIVFLSDYRNFNPYILQSFPDRLDIRWMKHSWLARYAWNKNFGLRVLRKLQPRLLKLLVVLMGGKATIPEDFCEREDDQVAGSYFASYLRLMHSERGFAAQPPPAAIEQFQQLLHATVPESESRWFVSLYLRRKRPRSVDVRDFEPAPFRAVVEQINALGGFVLCGGDFNPHDVYPGLEGVYGYDDFPCERALCDIFFLTQCRFLICTHSGPAPVAAVFGTPELIINCAFFYLSGFYDTHRYTYKKLREKATGRVLSAKETFSRPIIEMIENEPFAEAGLEHIDNTEEELLSALKEMTDWFILGQGAQYSAEDDALLERFRSLLPENAVNFISPARPAMSYLRSLQWD